MSRILVLSIIFASVSTIVGCGASAVQAPVVCDESWNPPGEFKMSIADSAKANAAAVPNVQTQTERMKSSMRPNGNDRPTRGAVHAATY
jgi:hypothetical protein